MAMAPGGEVLPTPMPTSDDVDGPAPPPVAVQPGQVPTTTQPLSREAAPTLVSPGQVPTIDTAQPEPAAEEPNAEQQPQGRYTRRGTLRMD